MSIRGCCAITIIIKACVYNVEGAIVLNKFIQVIIIVTGMVTTQI